MPPQNLVQFQKSPIKIKTENPFKLNSCFCIQAHFFTSVQNHIFLELEGSNLTLTVSKLKLNYSVCKMKTSLFHFKLQHTHFRMSVTLLKSVKNQENSHQEKQEKLGKIKLTILYIISGNLGLSQNSFIELSLQILGRDTEFSILR